MIIRTGIVIILTAVLQFWGCVVLGQSQADRCILLFNNGPVSVKIPIMLDLETDGSLVEIDSVSLVNRLSAKIREYNPEFDIQLIQKNLTLNLSHLVQTLQQFSDTIRLSTGGQFRFQISYFGATAIKVSLQGTNVDFWLSLLPSKKIVQQHPMGSYFIDIDRPYENLKEMTQTLDWMFKAFVEEQFNLWKKLLVGNWRKGAAETSSDLVFDDLPGFYLRINNPSNTEKVFRGSHRLGDESRVNALSSQGFIAKAATPKDISHFLTLESHMRIEKGIDSIRWRKGGDILNSAMPMYGLDSMFVGVAEGFYNAKFYGEGYVAEMDIPREVLINPSPVLTSHKGEDERLVLFRIHPSWIKRIYDPAGHVIYQKP